MAVSVCVPTFSQVSSLATDITAENTNQDGRLPSWICYSPVSNHPRRPPYGLYRPYQWRNDPNGCDRDIAIWRLRWFGWKQRICVPFWAVFAEHNRGGVVQCWPPTNSFSLFGCLYLHATCRENRPGSQTVKCGQTDARTHGRTDGRARKWFHCLSRAAVLCYMAVRHIILHDNRSIIRINDTVYSI